MEDHHHHHRHRPLIHPSAMINDTATTRQGQVSDHDALSSFNITFRLSLIALFTMISIWANHEASKGFPVTVINAAAGTFAGKRFHLFYVSNDEATRIVIKASKTVENFLYPDNNMGSKKEVKGIIFKLMGSNSSDEVVFDSQGGHGFVINVSPLILEGKNFKDDMVLAVQRGVARVWLWDGQGESPKYLMNGIVEYIITRKLGGSGRLPPSLEEVATTVTVSGPAMTATDALLEQHEPEPPQEGLSSAACWKSEDRGVVAGFLEHCESRRPGFISRLNGVMKYGWHDDMFGIALGMPVQDLCTSFGSSRNNFSSV